MKSMTGYGVAVIKGDFGDITIEIKSVNHRFLECQFRLPSSLLTMEDQLRKKIKDQILRGKIDISIHFEEERDHKRVLHLDEDLLDQYVSAAKLIEHKLGSQTQLDITALVTDQSIAHIEEMRSDLQIEEGEVLKGLDQALHSLNEMRSNEGSFLQKDMQKWLDNLLISCEKVEQQAPLLIERYREKMEVRIRSFLNKELDIDEARLLTEIAIFADKMDVSEELVRLKAHIGQYKHYLTMKKEAIGRRLDFLIQEMNREVNTIGSKGADTSIRQDVVEMKGLLEKLKEQVQNVE
jgi:uncharacterized protein (TIGR00255 family)